MHIKLVIANGFSSVYTHARIIFLIEQSAEGEGFSMFNAEKIIRHGYANEWKVKIDFLFLCCNPDVII